MFFEISGEISVLSRLRMKLFKVFLLFLLLGGDYRLKSVSLEAFPQACGCDGRANLLFAPTHPVLLHQPHITGGTALLLVVVFLLWELIRRSTDLKKPVPAILLDMLLRSGV